MSKRFGDNVSFLLSSMSYSPPVQISLLITLVFQILALLQSSIRIVTSITFATIMVISKTCGQADYRINGMETQDEDKTKGETPARAEGEDLPHDMLPDCRKEPNPPKTVILPELDSPLGRLLIVLCHTQLPKYRSYIEEKVPLLSFKALGVEGVASLLFYDRQLGQDVIRACQEQILKKIPPEKPSDPPPDRYLIMSHTELKDLIINAIAVVLIIHGVPSWTVEIARHLCKRNGKPRDIPKTLYKSEFRIFIGGILLVMQLVSGERDIVYPSSEGVQNPNRLLLLLELRQLLRGQKFSQEHELLATTDHSNHPDSNSGKGDLRHSHNTELAPQDSQSTHAKAQSGS